MSRDRYAGKVVAVIGVGPLGAAIATRAADEGAALVLADIDTEANDAFAATLTGRGVDVLAVTVDVTDEPGVAALAAAVAQRHGHLDVLCNNVGYGGDDEQDGPIESLDWSVWQRTMTTNPGGVMLACKHLLPLMRDGGGAVVNTASISGLWGDEVRAAYAASKAAVMMLTKSLATMYGKHGVRVNAVAPSLVLSEKFLPVLERTGLLDLLAAERLLADPSTPEEIAGVVLWLASDEARGITGQTIVVDGGATAHRHRHSIKQWDERQGRR